MPAVSIQLSSNIAAVAVRTTASSCVVGGVALRPRRSSRRGLATDRAWKLCAAFCLVFIIISLYARWRQQLIGNDSVTAADETFAQIERELCRQPLCWPGKISTKATNPIAGESRFIKSDEKIHPHSWCFYRHWPCRGKLRESQRSFLRNLHVGCGNRFRRKSSQSQAERLWSGKQSWSLARSWPYQVRMRKRSSNS